MLCGFEGGPSKYNTTVFFVFGRVDMLCVDGIINIFLA
jgi:hypothetical protein